MSYNIIYNPDLKRRYPTGRKNNNKPLNSVLILLASFVAVYGLMRCNILHYLLPGDSTITAEAFSTMVKRVSQGEAVRNAVVGFCREIIHSCR